MSEPAIPITARALAARVLVRVVRDEAFAAASLEAELSRAIQLDDRDRALATELVYGTLRVLPWLVSEIDARAKKPTRSLPWDAQGALWVAAQQIYFMRVPAFAAVDEAVTAVRRSAGGGVAGFANALLRKLANARPKPDEQPRVRMHALVESCPHTLRQALERALGGDGARAFLSETAPPPTGLRVTDQSSRDAMVNRLRTERPHAEIELGKLSPLCINAHKLGGRLDALPGFIDGALSIQEEGSQVVALSLGARSGERVLDACAGRGNKTSVLALAGGRVDACDRDARKLERLAEDLARLRTSVNATFAVDWTVGSGDVQGVYDAVLVDAPCSGIGTLRRRPEVALRASRPLAERTAEQRAILLGAARCVAPGGRLVYAVCSVLREEAEEVVAQLDGLEPAPFASEVATAIANTSTSFRLLPHVDGCDGYFLASFRKRHA